MNTDTSPAADAAGDRPQRVRVTAPGTRAALGGEHVGAQLGAHRQASAGSTSRGESSRGESSSAGGSGSASDEVYVRSLIRSQLRLALVVASGFLVSLLTFALTLRLVPELEAQHWFGVPVSWLLLAFGVYPMIGLSAWLYVRVATRNESRYRALVEEGA